MSVQSARARLHDVARDILNTGTSPSRTAASVALGVAVGLSPFVGLQTLVVIVAAFLLGLNRVAALLASCIFNPWTAFPIVVIQLRTGSYLLGRPRPAPGSLPHDYDLGAFVAAIQPYLQAYLSGGLALAAVGGVVAYPVVYWTARRVRAARVSGAPAPDPAGGLSQELRRRSSTPDPA